jgi:hypothetical protein
MLIGYIYLRTQDAKLRQICGHKIRNGKSTEIIKSKTSGIGKQTMRKKILNQITETELI